jgi:phosphonate transport system substrate-binding protein
MRRRETDRTDRIPPEGGAAPGCPRSRLRHRLLAPWWLVRACLGLAGGLVAPLAAGAGEPAPLRVAITPVLVEHYLDVNRQWVAYLGERLGRPTRLVQRRSYKEISDLLEQEQVDIAFVCGLPYVIDHAKFGVELLVAPQVYEAGPIYYSYVIVPADSSVTRFEELRGRRYAFSDPLSNSGRLVPTFMLARMGETPERFFKRYIYTYSHSANVEAVAVKLVDGASVDSYVYDYLAATNPALTSRTRILHRSPPHGITPVVVRRGLDPRLKEAAREVFLRMHETPRGREILDAMMIRAFVRVSDRQYDSIRAMKTMVERRTPELTLGRGPRP